MSSVRLARKLFVKESAMSLAMTTLVGEFPVLRPAPKSSPLHIPSSPPGSDPEKSKHTCLGALILQTAEQLRPREKPS